MPSDFFDAVNGGDVRMVQRREHFGFALEAGEAFGIVGEARREDFDRDVALQPRVARAIDLAHAAGAERCQHLEGPEAAAGLKGQLR